MSALKAKQFHLIEDMDIAALTLAVVERSEAAMTAVIGTVRTWTRRAADRRLLAQMNTRMLDDIGLTRHEVNREVAKYFWQQ